MICLKRKKEKWFTFGKVSMWLSDNSRKCHDSFGPIMKEYKVLSLSKPGCGKISLFRA